jgi:ribosomal protein L11 methylase PrmA
MSAAHHLGARHVMGCDIDFDSISIARCNLLSDALPPHVFAGSTRAVRSQSVDLLMANINAVTHQTLAGEYARIARRCLILSGFPDRHSAKVSAALEKFGFTPVQTVTRNEWVALVLCNDENS